MNKSSKQNKKDTKTIQIVLCLKNIPGMVPIIECDEYYSLPLHWEKLTFSFQSRYQLQITSWGYGFVFTNIPKPQD